jgi:hypothetical protein
MTTNITYLKSNQNKKANQLNVVHVTIKHVSKKPFSNIYDQSIFNGNCVYKLVIKMILVH